MFQNKNTLLVALASSPRRSGQSQTHLDLCVTTLSQKYNSETSQQQIAPLIQAGTHAK